MTFDKLGPTGSVVQGHVLDCSKKALEEKLRDYDPLLYVRWNPRKRSGMGIWEVRRRPEKNTAVYYGELNGLPFFRMEPVEINVVSHVLDVEYLNYEILTKLKAMDTWQVDNFADQFEYEERKAVEKAESRINEELRYGIKHHKKEMRVIKDYMQSNVNSPADLAKYWK